MPRLKKIVTCILFISFGLHAKLEEKTVSEVRKSIHKLNHQLDTLIQKRDFLLLRLKQLREEYPEHKQKPQN